MKKIKINWKRVAIFSCIGAFALLAVGFLFYMVTVLRSELRHRAIDRQLDEVDRQLIEKGLWPPTL